jgi:hypothetical protein
MPSSLAPREIRRRDRWHIAVVRTSWGHRRVRALGIRCRSVSLDSPSRHRNPPSRACPQIRRRASGIRRRERVPRSVVAPQMLERRWRWPSQRRTGQPPLSPGLGALPSSVRFKSAVTACSPASERRCRSFLVERRRRSPASR